MESQEPNIKFEPEDIENWADKYNYGGGSGRERGNAVFAPIDQVRNRQYLTKSDLEIVGEWKSPRAAEQIGNIKGLFVSEMTRFSLSTNCDRVAIESLTILKGVGVSIASTILYLFHEQDYPTMGFRALWSVSLIGSRENQHEYAIWLVSVDYCQKLPKEVGVCILVLSTIDDNTELRGKGRA